MKTKPKAGQMVRLNDTGIRQVGGLMSWKDVEAAKSMRIIAVSEERPCPTEDLWMIDVTGPMGQFLLDSTDVDLI